MLEKIKNVKDLNLKTLWSNNRENDNNIENLNLIVL